VTVTNVHLDTPRSGFEYIRRGRIAAGARELDSNVDRRDLEAGRARRWVDEEDGSHLVLGDFNTPVESVIYQRNWRGLENAFSRAGFGFGSTRFNGWIRIRIDHILMNEDWRTVRAFVGPDLGSDHRPMIADLRRNE
jgi:vancomycin resistance protein VanJ